MLIDLIIYDGLDELDVVGPMEVLRSAGQAGADLTVRLASRLEQQVVVAPTAFASCPT